MSDTLPRCCVHRYDESFLDTSCQAEQSLVSTHLLGSDSSTDAASLLMLMSNTVMRVDTRKSECALLVLVGIDVGSGRKG